MNFRPLSAYSNIKSKIVSDPMWYDSIIFLKDVISVHIFNNATF